MTETEQAQVRDLETVRLALKVMAEETRFEALAGLALEALERLEKRSNQ